MINLTSFFAFGKNLTELFSISPLFLPFGQIMNYSFVPLICGETTN